LSDDATHEAAIRQYMQPATDTLHGDGTKAGAAHFTEDADTINSFGQVSKGWANIEQATQAMLFRTPHLKTS
jgi:ketosteroid isomerase-like protein